MSETGWGTSLRSGTGRWTLGEVRDKLGDPLRGLRQVGGPSLRFGTGVGTLWVVRDGSAEPP